MNRLYQLVAKVESLAMPKTGGWMDMLPPLINMFVKSGFVPEGAMSEKLTKIDVGAFTTLIKSFNSIKNKQLALELIQVKTEVDGLTEHDYNEIEQSILKQLKARIEVFVAILKSQDSNIEMSSISK